MYARRRGVSLYYETLGAAGAPPLLMLRGLARTVRHWGAVLDELAPSFRVIVMDNRGAGRSSVPLPPYSTRLMADDAASVLDHAGIDRATVLGVSLGGMIAQQLCLRHPERVSRLVLGCTRAGGRTGRRVSREATLALLGAIRSSEADALAHTAPFVLSPDFLRDHPEVVAEWQRIALEQPMRRRGFLGQAIAALWHDTSRELHRIGALTLVVTGDADRLIDAENSRYLASRIPGARLETLRGAGHDFPTERPRELARLLRDFCQLQSSAGL
jgi:pimeloyl-ACP methyl ester carboxylesterase